MVLYPPALSIYHINRTALNGLSDLLPNTKDELIVCTARDSDAAVAPAGGDVLEPAETSRQVAVIWVEKP